MSDETYETAVRYLKDVVNGLQNSKLHDIASVRTLYIALCRIQTTSSNASEAELTSNANLGVLEETFSLKGVTFNKSIQALIVSVYQVVLNETPGYIARNVINSLLIICQNRSHQLGARECAATIIGCTVEKRSQDLGSILTDIVSSMTRFSKASEATLRIIGVQVLLRCVRHAGSAVSDTIAELTKLATKLTSDKSADVRCLAIELVSEIAKNSNGFTLTTADSLLTPLVRSLDDEVVSAQDAAAKGIALVYFEQIRLHEVEQEQAKIGQARGGSGEGEAAESRPSSIKRGSLLKFKDISMRDIIAAPKKTSDENDLQSVFRALLRLITKSAGSVRAGYVATLRYLLVLVLDDADKNTLEWIIRNVLWTLHDSTILSLPYEEIVNYRNRLSHVLHRGVVCNLSETEQLSMVSFYIATIYDPEPKNEHIVQLILNQLCVLITILQEAVVSLSQEIHNMILQQLKNSSFGVRSCAAFVLTSLAVVTPAAAATYLQDALTGAQSHVHLLRQFDEEDGIPDDHSETATSTTESQTPRKTPRDTERLQRMFCFHGHTLVISIILKNVQALSTGLPLALIMKTFDFGMDMLTYDIQSAPPNMRHVICSIIRAGSLIVASCLHMGYDIVKSRVPQMMSICSSLVTNSDDDTSAKGQELLYELMSVEAALVCISALLWYCPDSLVYDENCLVTIVEILESAFRAIKSKYQPKFRGHFRFRTLHVILLECFSWLPPGSFPNTCQPLFIEGLRVFRDSISSGFECSNMTRYIPKDYEILHVAGYMKNSDYPLTEDLMMLRVENHSVALQKKESEAFLATFSKTSQEFSRTPLHASEWSEPSPPCAFIDSRTIDASVALIGATFGHQSNDYQEKAIQLCSQAILQFFKPTSSSLFTSEDERKKKERKSYICIKNVIVMLGSIIKSFPYHNGMSLEMDLHWVQIVMEKMYDLLVSTNTEIRTVVSSTLGTFCGKIFGAQILETITTKLINHIKVNLEKKGESMGECVGHVLALSAIWENSRSAIVFECLKKSDAAILFKSNCLFTLARILKSRSSIIGSYDRSETSALISRIIHTLEVHVLSFSDNVVVSEIELLLICLQRLVNVALILILEIDPESQYLANLTTIWQIIQNCSNHAAVQRESLDFVVIGSTVLFSIVNPMTVVRYIKSLLLRFDRSYHCFLPTIVDCIRVLIMKHSSILCSEGLDIEMFKLLDWCVTSSPVLCTTPYWGLELNDGMTKVIGDIPSMQRDVEATLNAFVSVEVQVDPDHRVAAWLLLCRAIVLGLQPSKSDGEDDTGVMTLQQYLVVCRDRAAEKIEDIIARTRVKCLALQCATVALSAVTKLPNHINVYFARQTTEFELSRCPSSSLNTIPAYAALFLHDCINLACASAVFSIDDHTMICLQEASIDFLQCIINIYWDAVDAENTSGTKVLSQYIAQVVSAIRPCLSAKYSPSLQWTAANLAASLIRGGLITDKTVVRRLVKAILAPVEVETFTSRCLLSDEVAGEISLLSHVTLASNAAMLYNLCGQCSIYIDVDDTVKSSIAALFAPHLQRLSCVWDDLAVDSVRILQNYRKWPKGNAQSDCRRGGICYDATVDVTKLQIQFEAMLPFVVTAALTTVASGARTDESYDVTSRFVILDYVWENIIICSESKYFTSNAMHHPPSVLEPLVIYAYVCCASIASSKSVSVPLWKNFLSYFATQYLPNCKSIRAYCSGLQLVNCVLNHENLASGDCGWLAWRICIAAARRALSPLFNDGESDGMYPDFVTLSKDISDLSIIKDCKEIMPHLVDCLCHFSIMPTSNTRRVYSMSLFVAAAPLLGACFEDSSITGKMIKAVSILPQVYINKKAVSCADLIVQEMWRYHNLYLDAHAPRSVPEEAVGKTLVKLWIASNFSEKQSPKIPLHLEAILISRYASKSFVQSILTELLSTLQDAKCETSLKVKLAACLLPAMLEQICQGEMSVQMIIIKLLVVLFNILESNETRVSFLLLILPALCETVSCSKDPSITTAIGKAVTHVAKAFPMQFKEAIMRGTEKEKEVLQTVMRAVMQQSVGSSGDGAGDKAKGIKIDMSKYNKGDK